MIVALAPTTTAVADFAADLLADALNFHGEVLETARKGAADGTGARLSLVLQKLVKQERRVAGGRHVASLFASSETLLKRLQALRVRAGQIGSALELHLSAARAARRQWMADPAAGTAALEQGSLLNQLDRRVIQLQGALAGMERARLVLAQALAAEQLAHDELLMARDVATPVAAREAHLKGLAAGSRQAAALGALIDRDALSLLTKERARLASLRVPRR